MPARAIFQEEGGAHPDANAQEQAEHLRLANILDQMPVGIGIFDQAGHLFHANRHFEKAAGGALSSLRQMQDNCWRPVADDGATIVGTIYPPECALAGQIATPGMNFVRQMADGREHWVVISAVPLTAPGETRVVGVVVVAEDGEGRKRHVEQLRLRDERFRRFAKYSSDALWIADIASGAMEHLSPGAAKICDDPGAISTLDTWNQQVHSGDLPLVVHARQQASQGATQRFEYRLVDRGGDVVRRVRETSFPIPCEDGRGSDCIGGILEDISREVQIYLVQHDASLMDLSQELSRSVRSVKHFARAGDFMNVADVLNPGCVVIDLRGATHKPGSLSELLVRRPPDLQLVFVGSKGTPVGEVIDAMRAGAVDFLLEPIMPGELTRSVKKAVEALPSRQEDRSVERSDLAHRLSSLPRREREVLLGLVSGGTNKMIARTLGISPRTVEVHRAHLMERLNVRNLSELLEFAHSAGLKATTL